MNGETYYRTCGSLTEPDREIAMDEQTSTADTPGIAADGVVRGAESGWCMSAGRRCLQKGLCLQRRGGFFENVKAAKCDMVNV